MLSLKTRYYALLVAILLVFVLVMASGVFYQERVARLWEIQQQVLANKADWLSLLGTTKSLYVSTQTVSQTFADWQEQRRRALAGTDQLLQLAQDNSGQDPLIMQSIRDMQSGMAPGVDLTAEFAEYMTKFLATPRGRELDELRQPVSDLFAYQAARGIIDDVWITMQKIKALVKVIDLFNVNYLESQSRLSGLVEKRIAEISWLYRLVQLGTAVVMFFILLLFLYFITRINTALNHMVAERTASLNRSLEELRRTQDELLESRRQAATTSLIVGLTHEMNTPLGVSVTAQTALRSWTGDFARHLDAGTLTRNMTDAFVNNVLEVCNLLEHNLGRLSSHIGMFRKLSVDLDDFRFEYHDMPRFLDTLMYSLAGQAERSGIVLDWDYQGGTLVWTCPPAVASILNQLVDNALIHGFAGQSGGHIQASFHNDGTHFVIQLLDDGRGLEPAGFSRLLEPFYTTARAGGHMGIGLNIVHNLVTQVLRGTLAFEHPERGLKVLVTLPALPPV